MKKLFIAALVTLTVATSAFAKDVNKVSSRTLHNFNFDFKGAQKVSWTAKNNFVKADFTLDGQKMEAFYSTTGDVIGTAKSITLDQLPTSAKRTFAKKYNGYTVKEAIRFEGVEESAYFISAENEKESVVLKVEDNSSISVFQKDQKN